FGECVKCGTSYCIRPVQWTKETGSFDRGEAGSGMRLMTATGGILTDILDGTYPIWGEGLSRGAYEKWNRAQLETPWGRSNLHRVACVDESRVLSSAKRYDLDAWVGERRVRVVGIGAVFTPPALRNRGHGTALITAMLADAAARGCELALLFSEIGARY